MDINVHSLLSGVFMKIDNTILNKKEALNFGQQYVISLGDKPNHLWKGMFEENFRKVIFKESNYTSVVGLVIRHSPPNRPPDFFALYGLPANGKRGLVIYSDHRAGRKDCPFAEEVANYFDGLNEQSEE